MGEGIWKVRGGLVVSGVGNEIEISGRGKKGEREGWKERGCRKDFRANGSHMLHRLAGRRDP